MPIFDDKEVGKRLKDGRLLINSSSRDFAIKAGIDPSQYAKIEKGVISLSNNIWDKLEETYGFDKFYILFGIVVPKNEGSAKGKMDNKSGVQGVNSGKRDQVPLSGIERILSDQAECLKRLSELSMKATEEIDTLKLLLMGKVLADTGGKKSKAGKGRDGS